MRQTARPVTVGSRSAHSVVVAILAAAMTLAVIVAAVTAGMVAPWGIIPSVAAATIVMPPGPVGSAMAR